MPNIFERKEKKYLLTKNQYLKLKEILNNKLQKDKYYNYTICNIYYDTKDYDLFRKSIDKPIYKEKLRLRSYGTPKMSDKVFLEIKKKYNGIVYKRRIDDRLDNIYSFIKNPNNKVKDTMNAKELQVFLDRYNVEPKVYLSYDRESYYWKDDENLRITFDTNIKYRFTELGLEYENYGQPLLDEALVLMEIKSLNNLPLFFCQTLSILKIYPISFSKIGTIYTKKILKKESEK